MKVAILWTGLSGYLNACIKELAGRTGIELFVCHMTPERDAPFEDDQFIWIPDRLSWRSNNDLHSLAQRLRNFSPDILVFTGWHVPAYRRVAREFSGRCWRVMTMDNCWRATLKQRAGTVIAANFLHPLADAVWLPGERQAAFANRLGFQERVILRGLYSCDQPAMETKHFARLSAGKAVPRSFLFVGRFVPEKGLVTLIDAYRIYAQRSADPWPLMCYGAGPLSHSIEGVKGVQVSGFIQPSCLPQILAAAGCLILPSKFDPWAVVVHEAASAGLVILASEKVGSVPHLVQPGYNGFIFGSEDALHLADLMSRLSAMTDAQLDAMSCASVSLSRQFSPKRWADTLLESFGALTQYSSMHR